MVPAGGDETAYYRKGATGGHREVEMEQRRGRFMKGREKKRVLSVGEEGGEKWKLQKRSHRRRRNLKKRKKRRNCRVLDIYR